MKPLGLTVTALILLTVPLAAQNPAPAPQPSPERLDQLLKAWEDRMAATESLFTKTSRTEVHPLTKKATTYVGEAAFQKPNLARIDLTHQDEVGKKDEEKTRMERIYCNGQHIYEYAAAEKKIIIHDMPKNNPADDNMIMSFLKGMKAEVAKKRFDISLTKEDQYYGYLMILPKTDADKAEFTAAQLTVWMRNPNPQGKPNVVMMPVRLWYRQPNGKEVTYTFADMEPNANLPRNAFMPMQIKDWKVERAEAAQQSPMGVVPAKGPTTVRNQNPMP